MRMDKLTSKFQLALQEAQSLALGRNHQFIEPAHLMLTMLDQQGGTVRPLLTKTGAVIPELRTNLDKMLDSMPQVEGARIARVQATHGLAERPLTGAQEQVSVVWHQRPGEA